MSLSVPLPRTRRPVTSSRDTERTNIAEQISELRRAIEEFHRTGEAGLQELEALSEAVARFDASQTRGLRKQLAAAQAELSGLKGRISVRLALKVAARTAAAARWVKRLRQPNPKLRPPYVSRPAVEYGIRRHRARTPSDIGPTVSIIIPTHNGAHHLRRLFRGLTRRTSYSNFEVIVVDNASTDDTARVLDDGWAFPVQVISNAKNESFSDACNQGAARAGGDLLLFLNNDVEPITPSWLSCMVESIAVDEDRVAVGALLVYSEKIPGAYLRRHPDFSVQHNGVAFTWRDGVPTGVNLGSGTDPSRPSLTGVREVPAASAACLLVDRAAFDEVEGFSPRYVYGWEDVDLCMKLRWIGGRVVMDGDAVLFHYEFGTQETLAGTPRRVHYLNNHRSFGEMWGPALSRALRTEALGGETFWRGGTPLHIGITLTRDDPSAGYGDWYTAHELGEALADEGATVSYLEQYSDRWYDVAPGAALIINLLPDYDLDRLEHGPLTVAWIRNWPDRWLDNPSFHRYDLAFVASKAFADKVEARSAVTTHLLPLATNPTRFTPGPAEVTYAADYTFTGNVWGRTRDLVNRIEVEPEETFTIYGKGWEREGRVQRYVRGELSYDVLPRLYRSVRIVLDDTVQPNRPALNSRVFDALAAGALVITDNGDGSGEWFDGKLPAADTRAGLRQLLDRYLADEELRVDTVNELRATVLNRHTYPQRAQEVLRVARDLVLRPKMRIKTSPPSRVLAPQWGDTHFALDFARALRRQGWNTAIDILPEWDETSTTDADVVLHLRGLNPYVPKPGAVNVLWIISHPEEVTPSECDRYDVVFVASRRHADSLASKVSVPVYPLLQATDGTRFSQADPFEEEATDLLFVGNSRLVYRHGVKWAIAGDLPLSVWGSGWEPFLGRNPVLKGVSFPNERLPGLTAAARVVLNDHWADMAENGFISNRIFDAGAAGTVVVTDPVPGLDDALGVAVPTYDSQQELVDIVTSYLADEDRRREHARALQTAVLASHTFDHRAEEFLEVVAPILDARQSPSMPAPVRSTT